MVRRHGWCSVNVYGIGLSVCLPSVLPGVFLLSCLCLMSAFLLNCHPDQPLSIPHSFIDSVKPEMGLRVESRMHCLLWFSFKSLCWEEQQSRSLGRSWGLECESQYCSGVPNPQRWKSVHRSNTDILMFLWNCPGDSEISWQRHNYSPKFPQSSVYKSGLCGIVRKPASCKTHLWWRGYCLLIVSTQLSDARLLLYSMGLMTV